MRFIHISDVHLGMTPDKGKAWSGVRAKEIEDTFDKILQLRKKERSICFLWREIFFIRHQGLLS